MAALCLLLNVYALLQDFTLTERSELLELRRKLMLNILIVSALSSFFCLDLNNFKEKVLVKPHHLTDRMLAKLATFVISNNFTHHYFFLLVMVTKTVAAWSTVCLHKTKN